MNYKTFLSRRLKGISLCWYLLVKEPYIDIKTIISGYKCRYYLRKAVKEAGGPAIGNTKAWKKYIKLRRTK